MASTIWPVVPNSPISPITSALLSHSSRTDALFSCGARTISDGVEVGVGDSIEVNIGDGVDVGEVVAVSVGDVNGVPDAGCSVGDARTSVGVKLGVGVTVGLGVDDSATGVGED